MVDIRDKIKEIEKHHNVKVVYLCKSGSTLYGTQSEDSDVDYKGIFIPSVQDLITQTASHHIEFKTGDDKSSNTKDDIDLEIFSIHRFLELVQKGDTNAIDLLFSTKAEHFHDICVIHNNPAMSQIYKNFNKLLTKNIRAFTGYCLSQSRKYCIKGDRFNELNNLLNILKVDYTDSEERVSSIKGILDSYIISNNCKYVKYVFAKGARNLNGFKEEEYLEVLGTRHIQNIKISELITRLERQVKIYGDRTKLNADGIDPKALSHALRVVLECQDYLSTGHIQFPLRYAESVKAIKYTQDRSQQYVESVIQQLETELSVCDLLVEDSKLPERVTKNTIYNIIDNIYKEVK